MKPEDPIGDAFRDVPYPGDEALTACPCEECRGGVGRFVGKDWRTLRFRDAVSDQNDANIKVLSPLAFRYFLPGLMRLALTNHVDSFPIAMAILERLSTSDLWNDRTDSLKAVQAVIDTLSPKQRGVIARSIGRLRERTEFPPVMLTSACENLITGVARPYSQEAFEA